MATPVEGVTIPTPLDYDEVSGARFLPEDLFERLEQLALAQQQLAQYGYTNLANTIIAGGPASEEAEAEKEVPRAPEGEKKRKGKKK